jgi:[acyl-carrier-protein] S-malonyltransferase
LVAGHSLGEYSAHVAAGTLGFSDAVRIVRLRGQYMQEAVPLGVGTMAAILGMALPNVMAVCHHAARGEVCEPANINSPEQIVISGNSGAVKRAALLAEERGAKKARLLPVSAPFHCALMKPAQDRLTADLNGLTFRNPSLPVACNVDAQIVHDSDGSRNALIRQVTGAVKWDESVRLLIQEGAQTFVEVGPGKVLWGLMRQIDRHATGLYVNDETSLEKTLRHFAQGNA